MTVHDMTTASARVAERLMAPEPALITGRRMEPRTRKVCELSVAMLASDCVARLAESDIHVEQCTDFDLALETVGHMDKPYLTDFLSPRKNDFFESNCFWLILRDGEGMPSGMIGARIDETGGEPLSSYSVRKLRNMFPEEDGVPVRPDRLPRIAEEIRGRVVYIGDLFFGQRLRTTNRQMLRTFLLLHYCVIHMKWREFDWLYAFLRDRDVARGAPWLYHFPRVYPLAHSWTLRPSVETREHWLAAMDRLEFSDVLATYLVAPERL